MKYWRDRPRGFADIPAATSNMAAEFLQEEGLSIAVSPDPTREVRRIIDSIEGMPDDPMLAATTLLVIPAEKATEISDEFSGVICAVLAPDATDRQSSACAPSSTGPSNAVPRASFAVIDDGRGVSAIATALSGFLASVGEFCAALALAVSSREPYQSLVNIAESYFGRFMAITDASNLLLGYTHHILPEDEVNKSLVRLKHHAQQILQRETDQAISQKITDQKGIVAFPPDGKTFNQALVTYPVRIDGQFAAYIVMTCNQDEVTPGLLDAFGIFAFYCSKLCARRMSFDQHKSATGQTLLFHLIANQDVSSMFIREQAEALGIAVKGHFVTARIEWADSSKARLADYALDLCHANTHCIALPYKNGVVALIHGASEDEVIRHIRHMIDSYPAKEATDMLLSDIYAGLGGTHCAHRSLASITTYRARIEELRAAADDNRAGGNEACSANKGDDKRPNIIAFCDAFSLYWSDPCADEAIRDFSARHMVAAKIAADDKRNNTDNVSFLTTYLACERRISEVSRRCHLHRNGVQYRLKRIQATYNLDFNRFLTRQYVMSSLNVQALKKGLRDHL